MHTAFVKFFEDLRKLLSIYEKFKRKDIIYTDDFSDLIEMQLVYIHLSFRQIISEMKVMLDLHFDGKIEMKQAIYTGFNILLVVIYFFI